MTATATDWRTELKDDFDPDDENIPTPKDVRDVLLFDPDDPEWKPGEIKASRPIHPAIKKADRVRGKLAAIYREALRKLLEKYEGQVSANIGKTVKAQSIGVAGVVRAETAPVALDFLFRLVDFSADFFAAMRDAGTEAIQLGAVAALRDLGEDEHLTDKGVVQDFLIKRENKLKDVPQEVYDRIKQAIEEANVEGMSEKNAADYLREQVGDAFDEVYEGRAETVCRTEAASAYGTAAHSALKQAGFSRKKWVSSHDADVRPSHQDVDGEVVDADEEFSNGLMYPGDPDGDAEEVCNCRCGLVAVGDSEDEE